MLIAYSITVSAAATSTVSAGGGTTIDIKYLIGVAAGLGQQSGDPALGWGSGSWGGSTWGTPRSVSASDVKLSNSQWSLALWGEDLVATVEVVLFIIMIHHQVQIEQFWFLVYQEQQVYLQLLVFL